MEAADTQGVARASELFKDTFGADPQVAAAAPGRVNLIGEHVDYNDGFVFPLALEKNTYIVGSLFDSDAGLCEVVAASFPGVIAKFAPDDTPQSPDEPSWSAYVKGMAAIYTRNDHSVPAFRAAIYSDVPLGSGLSSSAALEMATGVFMERLGSFTVDSAERARFGQSCEREFAGVPCGIMDQLISSKGEAGRALLIDCRSLNCVPVPLDHPEAVIVIANSNVEHALSGSEYPLRREQCENAAKAIKAAFPDAGVTHLRDATLTQLEQVQDDLDTDTHKRALHVISEDRRTLEAKTCLEAGNLARVGELMVASHESLRDLFEVSTPEIDSLVNIALGVDGVYGSRITGGGFGGCTVTLAHKDAVENLLNAIRVQYPAAADGRCATVFTTLAGPGARDLTPLL